MAAGTPTLAAATRDADPLAHQRIVFVAMLAFFLVAPTVIYPVFLRMIVKVFSDIVFATSTGSFSCFCLSLGSRTPWGLFTRGSSYPGVFSSCIVLKHFSQMARYPLFTDFF